MPEGVTELTGSEGVNPGFPKPVFASFRKIHKLKMLATQVI